jgi:hypothetical protein
MRAAIAIAASAVAAGSNMPFDVSWIGNAALPTAWNILNKSLVHGFIKTTRLKMVVI